MSVIDNYSLDNENERLLNFFIISYNFQVPAIIMYYQKEYLSFETNKSFVIRVRKTKYPTSTPILSLACTTLRLETSKN